MKTRIFSHNRYLCCTMIVVVLLMIGLSKLKAQDYIKPTFPLFNNLEVNTFNGNLVYSRQDFMINGNMPINLSFYYNSVNDTVDFGFGAGWYFNFGMNYYYDSLNNIVLIRNGGRKDLYSNTGTQYLPPVGIYDHLAEYEPQKFVLTTKEEIKYYFADPAHKKLTSITDNNGNSITIGYESGFPVTISNSSGRSAALVWTGNHLSSMTYNDATYLYEYSDNFLSKVTNPKEDEESYQYHPNGKISVIAGYNGNPSYIEYNGGIVVNKIKSCLSEKSFSFTENKSYIIENGSAGKQITCYTYDDNQRVVQITTPNQKSVYYEYDSNNNVIKFTDFEGKITLYSYDANGNLLSSTNPAGFSATATYNPFNRIVSSVDQKGNTTGFTYDDNGNLLTISQPLGVSNSFAYDNTGNITQATDPLGNETGFIWDEHKNLTQINSPIGSVGMLYDNNGHLSKITDPNGNSRDFEYDGCSSCGQVSKVKINDTIATLFDYDANGNLIQLTDPNGNNKIFGYDGLNRLNSVVIPAGTTLYDYDEQGNLTKVTDANNHSTEYAYNSTNQVTSEVDPLGKTASYVYDANGNLITETDANGNTIQYTYNSLNQLIQKSYPGNADYFAYDAVGNLIHMHNNDISITFTYDALNRLLSKTVDNWNKTISYEYDNAGNRVKMTDPDGGITNYTYDANHRLTVLENPFGEITTFEYDLGGRMIKQSNGNGTNAEYVYDQRNALILLTNKKSNGEKISSYHYVYDKSGNRLSMTVNDTAVHKYTYDATDRLTQVIYPSGETESFTYDGAGNRIAHAENGSSRNYLYNEADQLITDGNATYTFDQNGNMTGKTENGQTTLYQYNALNRLVKIQYPDGTENSFVYDPFGNRISLTNKAGQVTKYLLDGDNVLMELSNAGNTQAQYTTALSVDSWISMHRSNQSYVFHKDGLNSTTALSDGTQGVAASYSYSAFGEIKNNTGNISNPYTFTGREYDTESGNYYYRTRYYNSKIGRFNSKDIFKGYIANPVSLNKFVYVNNNPLIRLDPYGLWEEEVITIILEGIGLAAGGFLVAGTAMTIGSVVVGGYMAFAIGASIGNLIMEIFSNSDYKAPITPLSMGLGYAEYFGAKPGPVFKKIVEAVDLAIPLAFGIKVRKYKDLDRESFKNLIKNWQHLPRYLRKFTVFSEPMYIWKKLKWYEKLDDFLSIGSKGRDLWNQLSDMFNVAVILPVDPNEIIGPTGYDVAQWVSVNQNLAYTVLFENDPDFATAPAQNVLIKVPIADKLNMNDFRLGNFGFGNFMFAVPQNTATYTNRLDLRDSLGLFVDVTAGLNVNTQEAFWLFESIDPATGLTPSDAQLGFLPVNDTTLNAGNGEGFISFTIKPRATDQTGDSLQAHASIVFDENAPLITNTWVNIVDALPPVSAIDEITAIPGTTAYNITFSGQDDPGGCGISSFLLYFAKNNDPFQYYAEVKADSLIRFTASENENYQFFSIAKDNTGNKEAMKTVADTLFFSGDFNVFAGEDANICRGENYQFADATSTARYFTWSGGDGTFSSTSSLTPVYTPGALDIANGTVTLIVNAYCLPPYSFAATDSVVLQIQAWPIANAGADALICENQTWQLSGTVENESSYFWQTSGDGNFDNNQVLNPVYMPGTTDIAAKTVELTLTVEAISPCVLADVSSMILEIQWLPIANAGANALICENQTWQLSGSVENESNYFWQTSGDGNFNNNQVLNPVYTPGTADISAKTVELTLTAEAISPCVLADVSSMTLEIQWLPIANAGADALICENQTWQLSGTVENESGYFWQTSGDGNFDNNQVLNPVYTPGAADIAAKAVELTLTAEAISPCVLADVSSMTLEIQWLPIANAGADATICENGTHQLSGTAQNQSAVLWTTSGTGTFSSTSSLSPVYTPSAADIASGSVVLTLSASAVSPCTISASDTKVLQIQKLPLANAGADALICENGTHQLSGTAQNQSAVLWTTSGTGTFSSTSSLSPVYTPSAADIASGSVVLTLTASAVSPCTISASDTKVLQIQKLPLANAGSDALICENQTWQLSGSVENESNYFWQTSGDGNFDDNQVLNPVYTPGTADISAKTVELSLTAEAISPCVLADVSSMTLSIQWLPIANAGSDALICENQTWQLSGSVENESSYFWQTSGDGNFNDNQVLNPVYTPGSDDISAKTVELTLTAEAISPCILTDVSSMTLEIQWLPIANAGADALICENQTWQLSGTVENESSYFWQTSGDGNFNDNQVLNPVYTPGSDDISAKTVELTLTAEAISPCVLADVSAMTLEIQWLPIANAGVDALICENQTWQLSGTVENESGYFWQTSGDGNFNNNQVLNPVYMPGTADIAAKAVELTLTAEAISPCVLADVSSMMLEIQSLPIANAGADALICENQTWQLSGTVENESNYFWQTSGDGNFDDNQILNPVYMPGTADISAKSVELTLTAAAISPCVLADISSMTLEIQWLPIANAGNDALICENQTWQLSGTVENESGYFWQTSGDGNFDDNQILNPVYMPGTADISAKSVELTLTAAAISPCVLADISSMTLEIQWLPFANAGADALICENQTWQLSGTVVNESSYFWQTSGDGNFDDNQLLNPVYTPGAADIAVKTVELTLTAEAISPCVLADVSSMMLEIQWLPIANAGADALICENQTWQLSGTVENESSYFWQTSGDGNFNDNQILNPIYTPGTIDLSSGIVELTLFAEPQSPCSLVSESSIILSIQPLPGVNAGESGSICHDEVFSLTGSVTNAQTFQWTTNGDGTFNDSGLLNPAYTPGDNDINYGSAILTLSAEPVNPCTTVATDQITLEINYCHDLVIPYGWSGVSTFVNPINPDLEDVFGDVVNDLIILQSLNAMYWPGQNINTIGQWNTQDGYTIKVASEVDLTITGSRENNSTLQIAQGWNLIPVLSDCDADVSALFEGKEVIVAKEVAGWNLYWPQFNINTLGNLIPGKAYFVLMGNNGEVTFPPCSGSKGTAQSNLTTFTSQEINNLVAEMNTTAFDDYTNTAITHSIAVPVSAGNSLMTEDVIGVYTQDGQCFGLLVWKNETAAITLFGNDPTTTFKDGFYENEPLHFNLYRPDHREEFLLEVKFDQSLPNPEMVFSANGLSAISKMELNLTGFPPAEPGIQIQIIPNPAKDEFLLVLPNAEFIDCRLEIYKVNGQFVQSMPISGRETKIDISRIASGVYILNIEIDNVNHTKRLIKH